MKELCVETNLALSFQGATAEFKTQFISTWQRCKNEALLVVDTKQSKMPTWQSHYQSSNKKKQQYENSILHRLGCDWANLSGGRMPNPTAEKMTALQNLKKKKGRYLLSSSLSMHWEQKQRHLQITLWQHPPASMDYRCRPQQLHCELGCLSQKSTRGMNKEL